MAHYETDNIYINLKGDWPEALIAQVRASIATFFSARGHDHEGQPDLDDDGLTYVYDTKIDADPGLAELTAVLNKGPAWVLRFEEGDAISIRNLIQAPGIEGQIEVLGDLSGDPLVPLSRVDDAGYLAQVRAAVATEAMGFSILQG